MDDTGPIGVQLQDVADAGRDALVLPERLHFVPEAGPQRLQKARKPLRTCAPPYGP